MKSKVILISKFVKVLLILILKFDLSIGSLVGHLAGTQNVSGVKLF